MLCRDVIIAVGMLVCFLCGVSSQCLAAKPNKLCVPPECTEARSVRDEETLEAIEIVVRIPKPEAQIFTPKMKTKYESIMYEKSFLRNILDSVKDGPF